MWTSIDSDEIEVIVVLVMSRWAFFSFPSCQLRYFSYSWYLGYSQRMVSCLQFCLECFSVCPLPHSDQSISRIVLSSYAKHVFSGDKHKASSQLQHVLFVAYLSYISILHTLAPMSGTGIYEFVTGMNELVDEWVKTSLKEHAEHLCDGSQIPFVVNLEHDALAF